MLTNRRRTTIFRGILAFALILISCDVSTLVSAPQVTAPPPGAVNTIVVLTAQAAATQTAALLPPTLTPTLTPIPTQTASITPSPTATFLFILATTTRAPKTSTPGPASRDFACSLTDQVPGDDAVMSKNQNFSVSWTVQNTGGAAWDSNSVDFIYSSGTKLSPLKAVDLPKSVAAGDSITLKVTMQAPNSPDSYKTVWTLRSGKDTFCRLSISIIVK